MGREVHGNGDMTNMEYRSRPIRLSEKVWNALQKSELSANQILSQALLGEGAPREVESSTEASAVKKVSKKEQAVQERAASDVVAQAVEREDIDYSDVESTPTTNVAHL